MRRVVDLWSPAIGSPGTVIAYGHWGRPVLVFPAEAGRAGDFESHGMVDAVADLVEARPRQALLRGQLRLPVVVAPRASRSRSGPGATARTSRGSSTRSRRWIHDDCGGPLAILTTGSSIGAFHAANFTLRRGDLFPRALCLSGSYDPSTWHGWGERGDALYFQNPIGLRQRPARRPPGLAARAGAPRARVRAGHVGGHHRRAGQHPEARRPARREGHPARAGRVGARRGARLAVVAAPARPPPAPDLLRGGGEHEPAPGRAAARHRGGLARGLRDDHAAARAGPRRRGRRARLRRRADHDRAVRPARPSRATTSSSTGWRTGTTTRASG